MIVPKAPEHAHSIRLIHALVKSHPVMKEYYNEKVEKYFETFERKCREGLFEELSDIENFCTVGTDKHNLTLWIRLKGSNRCENVHHKMKACIGAWTVGPKVAHFILLLLSFRYNISTEVNRNAGINHGHSDLHYIDRLQNRILQIYGATIYPNHKNISNFHAIDFISVGIGPLHYSSMFVEQGEPDERLTNDMKFLAKRMGVKMPPLMVAHKDEIRIFNQFMTNHVKLNANLQTKLCQLFKLKANGTTIFPKLPSMIKNYEGRWKMNSLIIAAQKTMQDDYERLLKQLTVPVSIVNQPAKETEGPGETVAAMMNAATMNSNDGVSTSFVSPINAPEQNNYLKARNPIIQATRDRRCAWYPFCTKMKSECRGNSRDTCKFINEGIIRRPGEEEFVKAKQAAYRIIHNQKARAKRHKKQIEKAVKQKTNVLAVI